jgi:hypothetical protein
METLSLIDGKPIQNTIMYFYANTPQEIRVDYEDTPIKTVELQYTNKTNLQKIKLE